jgi:hypothetical protein
MKANQDEAVRFLKWLRLGGPWVLTAIIPDGPITTITAATANEVRAFVREHDGKSNLYYTLNVTKGVITKKLYKKDITAIEFVHGDLDPRDDETAEAAKARYFEALKAYKPGVSAVIDSGNGLQVLARLPQQAGRELIPTVEAVNKTLMEQLGSKAGTQNVDRLLRLPGTVNLPTKTKRERGREPCLAKLIEFNGSVYPLDAFPREERKASSGNKAKPRKRGATDKSFSGKFYKVCCEYFEAGWSDDDIARIVDINPKRWSKTSADRYATEGRLEQQIEACRKYWQERAGATLDDFCCYLPDNDYIFIPTRAHWPGASVNKRLPRVPLFDVKGDPECNEEGEQLSISPTTWLAQNRPIEQLTWSPGEPLLIKDRVMAEGGWVEHPGVTCFNRYRPPTIESGDAAKAEPWLNLIHSVFMREGDAADLINYFAHRVQRPAEKINYAVLLGGAPGIGKDTIIQALKEAVGPWNFKEASPRDLLSNYNGFAQGVVLRISEAHDLGDISRYSFYEALKGYCAAPPDVIPINIKYTPHHNSLNVCGVLITSNYRTDAMYLPADDRRTLVLWSDVKKEEFVDEGYWPRFWEWYRTGGFTHVAAYLRTHDLTGFDPKAPPRRTTAFHEIVDAHRAPEDAELADVLDRMGNPDVVTLAQIIEEAKNSAWEFSLWLRDKKNRRAIPYRMDGVDYVPVRNKRAADGLWKIKGARQAVYAKKELLPRRQLEAVQQLVAGR